MNYYIDIKIKPDSDMRENQLMGLVFTKFHKALVKIKSRKIGISFPNCSFKLGQILRLHGDKPDLILLKDLNWLGRLLSYCDVSDIQIVPTDAKYRTISRVRSKMNIAKLKRLKLRGSITTPDQEKKYKAKMFSQGLEDPYLDLKSSSTGQVFRYFFRFNPIGNESITGLFDSYGLSKSATIPWF